VIDNFCKGMAWHGIGKDQPSLELTIQPGRKLCQKTGGQLACRRSPDA
jgi:hypothetical protein